MEARQQRSSDVSEGLLSVISVSLDRIDIYLADVRIKIKSINTAS